MLRTARLRLRPWRDDDRPAFATINADPRVVEYLPKALNRAESDALVDRILKHFDTHGFGLWAVEPVERRGCIGFVGLSIPGFVTAFTPCVEIGWRLASDRWGQGYATEAARAALAYGFNSLGLNEVVSFTVPANVRSRRVMEKLGMEHSAADDFEHPALPEGHPLRPHLLYRLSRAGWQVEVSAS